MVQQNPRRKQTVKRDPDKYSHSRTAKRSQGLVTDKKTREATIKVIRSLDEFRSPIDLKPLYEEGYEIDFDRLVGVGQNSAVFLAHTANAPAPQLDKFGQKPLYTPGYDIAAKIIIKKWIDTKRPIKTRTGNLKLALALGRSGPDHHILKVIDVFKTPERIFIFMQYCAYGNVISFIRRNGHIPEQLVQRWSSQMAASLTFLHKFQIAHRNYKLENILIDENLNAKLTGFGLSKLCIDLKTKSPLYSKTICGSEPYLAPEMLVEPEERAYDPRSADVWAFGVGIFLSITRRYPFEADNLRSLKQDISNLKYLERDKRKRIKAPIRQVLSMTFILDPKERTQMKDLCDNCPWLNVPTSQNVSKNQTNFHEASIKPTTKDYIGSNRSPDVGHSEISTMTEGSNYPASTMTRAHRNNHKGRNRNRKQPKSQKQDQVIPKRFTEEASTSTNYKVLQTEDKQPSPSGQVTKKDEC